MGRSGTRHARNGRVHAAQTRARSDDLLEQLRFGWDVAVEVALTRPALYALFAQHVRSHPDLKAEGYALMHTRVQRSVDTGRFRLPVDGRARALGGVAGSTVVGQAE
jgi:hypothetical protein